jgi:glycosyltransferase involved in cell wall biosynthesis
MTTPYEIAGWRFGPKPMSQRLRANRGHRSMAGGAPRAIEPAQKPKTLCLNMIVKNEIGNLPRCLRAVSPYICCWVMCDTGSTDGTQDFIKQFFAEKGIPGELHEFSFVDFSHARNQALALARAMRFDYDYLFLTDADMELVVENTNFRQRLSADAYYVKQRAPGLSYWNVRLLRRSNPANYEGVTHEYLNIYAEELSGIWFKDHVSGSNRPNKAQRDIVLLETALVAEPNNSRYWFYLARAYYDSGDFGKAAEAYQKRIKLGGWQEETWAANLQLARCYRCLGMNQKFVYQALATFNRNPQRAEPLYELARYYREQSMHNMCVMFCEIGLAIPLPANGLFVEDHVYEFGLFEEYSISAYYTDDAARAQRGHTLCKRLANNKSIPEVVRQRAAANLRFYERK